MNSKLSAILSKIIDKYSDDSKTSEYDLNKDSHISDSLYKNEIFNAGGGPLGNGGGGPLNDGGGDPIPNSFCNCRRKEYGYKLYGPNCFLCNCKCNPNNKF